MFYIFKVCWAELGEKYVRSVEIISQQEFISVLSYTVQASILFSCY